MKEKLLAAHRAGIDTVLIPKENLKDLEEVPANVRQALTMIPAEDVHTVLETALCEKPIPPAAGIRTGAYELMIVKRADFITSMKDYGDFATKGCPEVAFAGKSNVGQILHDQQADQPQQARPDERHAGQDTARFINVYQITNEINFIDYAGVWLREGQQGRKALPGAR